MLSMTQANLSNIKNSTNFVDKDAESVNEKERKPVCMRTASEFASETTLHGMGIIIQPRNTIFRKIVWILIVLTMAGISIAVVSDSVQTYLKYESITSVSSVTNKTLDLPAITICNMNVLKASGLDKHYKDIKDLVFESRHQDVSTLSQEKINTLKNISQLEFVTKTSFSAEDIFVHCYIRTGETVHCEDYVTRLITEQSTCYTFHSKAFTEANGTINQMDSGQVEGFTLTLDALSSELSYSSTHPSYGFFALVHDQNEYPYMQKSSFLLTPGEMYYIALQRKEFSRLPKPYSPTDCIDTSLPENKNYSKEECYFHCLMYALFKGECSYDGAWKPDCSLYDTYAIAFERYFKNFREFTEEKNECSESCLPKCLEITYTYKLSSALFHDVMLEQIAAIYDWREKNKTYIKQNYVQVKFYYDTLSITRNKQVKSLDLELLLGNIGGQLGLLLGASIITLTELLEFILIYSIRIIFKVFPFSNIGKRKTTKVQNLRRLDQD